MVRLWRTCTYLQFGRRWCILYRGRVASANDSPQGDKKQDKSSFFCIQSLRIERHSVHTVFIGTVYILLSDIGSDKKIHLIKIDNNFNSDDTLIKIFRKFVIKITSIC